MEKRNKYLVIVLIVVFGIVGYYAYTSYRMSQMDKLMLEHNKLANDQINFTEADITKLIDSKTLNYDKILSDFVTLDSQNNQSISLNEQAYQYADGPYKDLLEIALKINRLYPQEISLRYVIVLDTKNVDNVAVNNDIMQKNDIDKQLNSVESDYTTFKSTHLDVKEHTYKILELNKCLNIYENP